MDWMPVMFNHLGYNSHLPAVVHLAQQFKELKSIQAA
jgi:hypothetical protein